MAVSMIRELKEVDIVQLEEEEKSELPRGWMLYDPPAIDAAFPRTPAPFQELNCRRLCLCDSAMPAGSRFQFIRHPTNSLVIRAHFRRCCCFPGME
jgi:hypothetical protein